MYRLGGRRVLRALVLAIGSKDLIASSEGPSSSNEDLGRTSSDISWRPV